MGLQGKTGRTDKSLDTGEGFEFSNLIDAEDFAAQLIWEQDRLTFTMPRFRAQTIVEDL